MRRGEFFPQDGCAMRRSRLKLILPAALVTVLAVPLVLHFSTLPKTEGTLTLAGIARPATVIRDDHGVPTIRAGNWNDAFFALGFAHAQDRFFQMELMRRAGAGRLSEMLGPGTLGTDRYMRKLGLYKLAEAQAATAPPVLKTRLKAYADGVNAWIDQTTWPRTVEFLALRHTPEPWRPADSLVWGKLMAVRLANNWRTERLRLDMLAKLSPDQVDFLWPPYPGDAPTAFPAVPGAAGLAAFPDMNWDSRTQGAPGTASNVWALAGTRTATGAPVLANDPHLEFRAPILWYLARLEGPDGVLAGATVPGVPFMVIGHNGHAAWGFTTTGADTEDLIVETTVDGSPLTYRTDGDGGTAEFRRREEIIQVRGADPETLQVLETPDGPVITDAGEGRPVTLTAPYLDIDDRTPEAMMALNQARSAEDIAAALRLFHAPVQNVMYATRTGDIGMITTGRIPERRRGDGRVPLARVQGPVGHAGYVLPSLMPRYANPPGGVLLNANNKITPPGFPFDIAADWPPPFRARRLAEMLAGDKPDAVAPQGDIVSVTARDLIPLALGQLDHAAAQGPDALALVRWNGKMDRHQRQPLIFMTWALGLKRAIFADELGDALFDRWHGLRARAIARALTEDRRWCDDVGTSDRVETCADAAVRAFEESARALREMDRNLGRTAVWGDVHVARFEHPVFTHLPLLAGWTSIEIATDGGNDTLNRGAMWLGRKVAPFQHRHGAGLRAVFDLGDPDASRFMIATGQSGNPLSSRYRDLIEIWRDGGYLTMGPQTDLGAVLKILPKD